MSDFGVIISINSKGELEFSESEKKLILEVIQKIKFSERFTDSLGEPFQFKIQNVGNKIDILLSEYWIEDETEDEMEDLTDMDLDEATIILEELKKNLGPKYTYEIYHGPW